MFKTLQKRFPVILVVVLFLFLILIPGTMTFGAGSPILSTVQNADGSWGIKIDNIGKASVYNAYPIRVDTYYFGTLYMYTTGYSSVTNITGGFQCTGSLSPSPWKGAATFNVTDKWTISGNVVTAQRSLTVSGSRLFDRFMDAIAMDFITTGARTSVNYFVPGCIYGSINNLKADCIGGSNTYGSGYSGIVRIREDRLPAPMFGIHFNDNTSITLLNLSPNGATIKADGDDINGSEVNDNRMQFGALGAEQTNSASSTIKLGYWFPGSEGEVTYPVATWQDWLAKAEDHGNHQWRMRLHHVTNGLQHNYTITLRFGFDEDFTTYQKNVWRYAWTGLNVNSKVTKYDIDTVRRTLVDFISGQVVTDMRGSGLLSAVDVKSGDVLLAGLEKRAYLGFIGKNLENVEYLLREAQKRGGSDASKFRSQADLIINTFIGISQAPPVLEGRKLNAFPGFSDYVFYPKDNVCYLRTYSDDMNAFLRAYQFEKENGRDHPTWLAYVKDFVDWLVKQQATNGSFPRAWNAGTGTVYDSSKTMTGLAVPLLLRMAVVTGDTSYKTKAINAGNFAWQNYLDNSNHFVGATSDRPDVIVHESSALAIEVFCDLYAATNDSTWLNRAKVAADINETWYYLWNIPSRIDGDPAELSVKPGVSTIGMNLCTTTNSGTDTYSSRDVVSYARLYKWTNDSHYLEIARMLMHSTKNMMALPGRTYDLCKPGMQQEFWFLAPARGYCWIREYTPWVSANQLHGIFQTEAFDTNVYNSIVNYQMVKYHVQLSKELQTVSNYLEYPKCDCQEKIDSLTEKN